MALYFDPSVSDQYLEAVSVPVNGLPLSFSCWVNMKGEAVGYRVLFGIFSTVGADGLYCLRAKEDQGFPTNPRFQAESHDGTKGGQVLVTATADFTFDKWHHIVGVFASDTQWVMMDGGNYASAGSAKSFSSSDTTSIGHKIGGGGGTRGADAWIAECAVWNAALSAPDEGIALARGRKPNRVRPGNLVFYRRLIRDDDVELVGRMSMTPTGPPTVAPSHPPIIGDYRAGRGLFVEPSAPPVGNPWWYHQRAKMRRAC